MGVPKKLVSVAEKVEDCRFWKLRHVKLPLRYNGTRYATKYECTRTVLCEYNVEDDRVGGCIICGNVAKIPLGERP